MIPIRLYRVGQIFGAHHQLGLHRLAGDALALDGALAALGAAAGLALDFTPAAGALLDGLADPVVGDPLAETYVHRHHLAAIARLNVNDSHRLLQAGRDQCLTRVKIPARALPCRLGQHHHPGAGGDIRPAASFAVDEDPEVAEAEGGKGEDRKSTRLNSSHVRISYAV